MSEEMDSSINGDNSKTSQIDVQVNYNLINLPEDVVQEIFLYLTPQDIDNVWKSCKIWRCLYNCEYFWKKLCKINNFQEVEESLRWPAYNKYLKSFEVYWQGIFEYNRLLQHCWKNNICKRIVSKDRAYCGIVYFDDEILIAVAAQHQVNIYNSSTGKLIDSNIYMFIQDHGEHFLARGRRYKDLIAFWGECYLRVWNMKSKRWIYYIEESDMLIHDNGQSDNFEFYKSLIVIRHENVASVCFGDDVVAFGCNNHGVIQYLDLDCKPLTRLEYYEDVCIMQIKIIKERLFCVTVAHDEFMSACVWSVKQKVKLHEIKNVCLVSYDPYSNITENHFVFCDRVTDPLNCTLIIWNIRQGKHLVKINTRMNVVNFISNSWYIIADGNTNAQMWCIKTGSVVHSFEVRYFTENYFNITEANISYTSLKKGNFIISNYTPFINCKTTHAVCWIKRVFTNLCNKITK